MRRKASARDSSNQVVRSFVGFAVIGSINTIILFNIFAGTHFVISFALPAVLLIQLIPQILTKLLLPHVLHRIKPVARPLIIAALWMLVNILTIVQPPNVEPPTRILENGLAGILSASTEVICLGMVADHGPQALTGWGFGTGLGALICVAGQYIWTVKLAHQNRDGLSLMWYLILVLMTAMYLIGTASKEEDTARKARSKEDDVEMEDRLGGLLGEDEHSTSLLGDGIESSTKPMSATKALVRPYMTPLVVAFTLSASIYPGISRAIPASPKFSSFFVFSSAYGTAFQLGNLLTRSSFPYIRLTSFGTALLRLALISSMILINTVIGLLTFPLFLWFLAFIAGASVGLVYINVFGLVWNDEVLVRSSNRLFALEIVGVGESIGLLIGGILGYWTERLICQGGWQTGDRWCQQGA